MAADKYEKILLNILIFLIFISWDLFLLEHLPNKLISNILFKPSGVDLRSILSQKNLPSCSEILSFEKIKSFFFH